MNYLAAVFSYLTAPAPAIVSAGVKKKRDDTTNDDDDIAMARRSSTPPQRLENARAGACSVFYSKACKAAVLPAAVDGVARQSSSLLYEKPKVANYTMERTEDTQDFVIGLDQLIQPGNMLQLPNRPDAPRTKFDNGFAIVAELLLTITSDDWDPRACYFRVQLTNIAPLQETTLIIGDRAQIIDRYMNPRPTKADAAPAACMLSQTRNVNGWCHGCGGLPNTITLFQTPLDDSLMYTYLPEAVAHTGTHGHIKAVLQPTKPAGAVASDDDSRLTARPIETLTRLEISFNSTLARELHQRNEALHQNAPGGAVIFAAQEKWHEVVARTSKRVLFNLPLAQLDRASIRIGVRHDGSSSAPRTLQFTLSAKCIGTSE